MTLAAIEFGGTKVLVTAGSGPGRHTAPVRLLTAAPEPTLQAVIAALEHAAREEGAFSALGIASFGPLELDATHRDYGRLLKTPKPGWSNVDLVGPLKSRFAVPVVIDTDVNAAALAEGRWGAARDVSSHAYITVGTGVGVGLVVDDRPVHGAGHPEGGHLRVPPRAGDVFPGACAWHGRCVEGLISGPALQARLGCPGAQIASEDPVWDLCGEYLAQLCAALVLLVAPQRIVVGGSVGRRPELLQPARSHLGAVLNGYVGRLSSPAALEAFLVPAVLEDAGLMGALYLASAKLLNGEAGG